MLKINLINLTDVLIDSHVKLNLDFLKKLLENASGSEKPYYDVHFVNRIGSTVNKKAQKSINIHQWLKGERTVPFNKLIKIMELSDYSWIDIEENLLSIKSGIKRGEICPKFPMTMGKEIGSIVGHILGDGLMRIMIFSCPSNYISVPLQTPASS